ncbi:MAG: protein-export chaperone SecB [Bacteroidales bacterium]
MEDKPKIQSAFRMLHFGVGKVHMDILDSSKWDDDTKPLALSVTTSIGYADDDKKCFKVDYKINLRSKNSMIAIDLEAAAFFESAAELSEADKASPLIKGNAPAMGFPFVRSFINTLTTNAGLPPLILPSFNFTPKA